MFDLPKKFEKLLVKFLMLPRPAAAKNGREIAFA